MLSNKNKYSPWLKSRIKCLFLQLMSVNDNFFQNKAFT